jgi:hypothetical protein
VQFVKRTVCPVDSPVKDSFVVEAQRVKPPPASIQKMEHRPYSVPKSFGLLGGESRAFHAWIL